MRRSWGYIFLQLRPISTWSDNHMCRWVDNTSEITRDWGLLECVPLTRSVPWRTDAMEDRIPTFTHSFGSLAQMLGMAVSLELEIFYQTPTPVLLQGLVFLGFIYVLLMSSSPHNWRTFRSYQYHSFWSGYTRPFRRHHPPNSFSLKACSDLLRQ